MKWSVFGRDRPAPEARAWILASAVAVLSAGAFMRGIGADFVYDDVPLIENNRYVHGFEHWPRWFTHHFWDIDHGWARFEKHIAYIRPLVSASYALDWILGGGSPLGYHVSNLLLHAVTSVLAFYALERWSGRRLGAFVASLVFALHPTKAESVAWISGRPDVLATLGLLVAAAGVARRLRQQRGGIPLELLGTLVAYGSKEQAVVLPVLAATEAWVATGRPALDWRDRELRRSVLRAALPPAIIALVYMGARSVIQPNREVDLTLHAQTALVLETYGRYLLLALWPADLTLFQAAIRSTAAGPVISWPHVAGGLVVLAGSAVALATLRRRAPAVVVGLGLFVVLLLPVSNVVFLGWMTLISPRYLYSPLLGVAFLVAMSGKLRVPRAALAVAGVLIVPALMASSMIRSGDFAWSHVFWGREYRKNPDAPAPARMKLERTLALRQPVTALRLAQRAHRAASEQYRHTGEDGLFILASLEILAQLFPDTEARQLSRLARFASDVVTGVPTAQLDLPGVTLELPARSRGAERLRQRTPSLWAFVALIESRLAHDDAAVRAAEAAARECPRCADILRRAATAAARAQRFDLVRGWLRQIGEVEGEEGARRSGTPWALAESHFDLAQRSPALEAAQARARAYSVLGAWGRAFGAVAPFEADARNGGPSAVYGFAHLAYAAGHELKARTLLLEIVPPHEVEELVLDFSLSLGRRDETPEDHARMMERSQGSPTARLLRDAEAAADPR